MCCGNTCFSNASPFGFRISHRDGHRALSGCHMAPMHEGQDRRPPLWRFFNRTPGPPPFSGMNSIPAVSRAWRKFQIVRL
jgi:hypothetical protein